MSDPRYKQPVAGLAPDELAAALRIAFASVVREFPPKTGICVFVFDFGAGGDRGLGYIANAQRADMVKSLREWLNKEAQQS